MSGLIHAHSGLRWLFLAAMIYALIVAFSGMSGNKPFTDKDRKAALFAFIFSHLQLVLGLVLLFVSGKVNFGRMMDSDQLRFFTLEHPVGMIIAIVLITLGYGKAKRGTEDKARFKAMFTYYLIALIIILASIPWPFRTNLGVAGWF